MDINLIRLGHDNLSIEDKLANDNYIIDLNDILFDNDYSIVEKANRYLLTIILIESDNFKKNIKSYLNQLTNPTLVMPGKSLTAFKGALEINSELILLNRHPLLVNGSDQENAGLIVEVMKAVIAKNNLINAPIALIGEDSNIVIDKTNFGNINKKYKIDYVRIGTDEFYSYFEKAKIGILPHKANISKYVKSSSEIKTINKIYQALSSIIAKYHLKGIAFNIKEFAPYYSFIARLFNEEGISFIAEDDIYGLTSLLILNAINDSVALYGYIHNIDLVSNTLLLHSNMVPYSLINKDNNIATGPITIFKISYNARRILAVNAKISGSRVLSPSLLEMDISIEDNEIFDIFRDPYGGTLAFTYGDSLGNVLAYDNILYIEQNNKN